MAEKAVIGQDGLARRGSARPGRSTTGRPAGVSGMVTMRHFGHFGAHGSSKAS
jgi:hypothetical protein